MTAWMGFSALVVFIYIVLAFVIAQWLRDNSLMDVFWGLGFILTTAALWVVDPAPHLNKLLVSAALLLWGIRLSGYILLRKWGRPEDFRYAQWRREWGRWFLLRSFVQIFLLQGALMWAMLLPVYLAMTGEKISLPLFIAGGLLFVTGFLLEAIADAQKSRFKKDPASQGHIIQSGLWSVSRHPNYLGEILLWWGIGLLALPLGWPALLSPLIITLLLNLVSGVPMLERRYQSHPEWAEYTRRVPRLLPLIGRRG